MNLRNETTDSRVTETVQNKQLQEFTLSIELKREAKISFAIRRVITGFTPCT